MKARIERGWKGRIASPGSTAAAADSAAASSIAACAAARASSPRARKSTRSVSPGSENQRPSPAWAISPSGGAPQLHRSHSGGLTLAIGWPASRKRGGGGPPHWLIAPKPPGQRFAS